MTNYILKVYNPNPRCSTMFETKNYWGKKKNAYALARQLARRGEGIEVTVYKEIAGFESQLPVIRAK